MIDYVLNTLEDLNYPSEVRALLVGVILLQNSKNLNLNFTNVERLTQIPVNGKNFTIYFC